MAGKKNEGIEGLKVTGGSQIREDRQVEGRTIFDTLTINSNNAQTVIYMLQSPENSVVLNAVASLEGFGKKRKENLEILSSLGIISYLIPLLHHKDYVVRRFAQKLTGMLCCLPEFREQIFKIDNILNVFVDILEKEKDVVMHEYAALTLAELTSEFHAASELLNVGNCIETLFERISSSDPDVEKNCLDIIEHMLQDINGIEAFTSHPNFGFKIFLELLQSNYPVIQNSVLQILKELTLCCRDPSVLIAFQSALGIEATLDILENKEWLDLHSAATELLINALNCPELCEYFYQSGCLSRLIVLFDEIDSKTDVEKILNALAKMSQTHKGRVALNSIEMGKRFCFYLGEPNENLEEAAAMGIANLAHYKPALNEIVANNPTTQLLEIIINHEKSFKTRNLASYALKVLCQEDLRIPRGLLQIEKFPKLYMILLEDPYSFAEINRNIFQTFTGISLISELRPKVINENFMSALLNFLGPDEVFLLKDMSVEVDVLECLSEYLIEEEARNIFNSLQGATKLIECLKSKYAAVREWAGHLVLQASQSPDFIRSFIRRKGLDYLISEKNTLYSMPSWQSAIDAIFAGYLPAKFAYTGRLNFEDITEEGFYVSSNARSEFFLIEDLLRAKISPIFPVYVANFNVLTSAESSEEEIKMKHHVIFDSSQTKETPAVDETNHQDLKKYTKEKKTSETFSWNESLHTYVSVDHELNDFYFDPELPDHFSKFISDPYLSEYVENLKKIILKEEKGIDNVSWFCIHPKLVVERTRIIAEFVVNELSGFQPFSQYSRYYKEMHINELKYQLSTNIIPLGFLRVGDYLERALLFKLLSDKIGFPCALVRGLYGRAWIEVAIPVCNIEDIEERHLRNQKILVTPNSSSRASVPSVVATEKSHLDSVLEESTIEDESFQFPKLRMDCFKAFPNHFLKPNAIVDLMDTPGRLLVINSRDADEYRGAFIYQHSKNY